MYFQNICNKIGHIKLQPLCFLDLLENLLKTPDLKGFVRILEKFIIFFLALIIESYGQGKFFLEDEKFIKLIKEAISHGIKLKKKI